MEWFSGALAAAEMASMGGSFCGNGKIVAVTAGADAAATESERSDPS
jgi:hypothetical protein